MNLSQNQKIIVNHIDGPLLVKAGAGCGKTRVLTERIKNLLSVEKRGKVLALTVSDMAAEKLRSRLEADPVFGEAIERVNIGTIHSFCHGIIQSRGYLIGLRPDVSVVDNVNDRTAILRNAIFDEVEFGTIQRGPQISESFISKWLSVISEQKRSWVPPKYCDLEPPFPAIYQKYNDVLWNQNAIDFDDILFLAYLILVSNFDIAKLYATVYHFICIDEAQDLTNAQYNIINSLCVSNFKNIMMVSDENQVIYTFDSSSSNFMSNLFIQDFNPTIYYLNENFRSAKQIVKFSNMFTGNTENLEKYVYNGELSATVYADEISEAQAVREMIKALMADGHKDIENDLGYHNFAVIARNKYIFSQIENEFSKNEIPFFYNKYPSGIACESDFMEAFELILRLLMNPLDVYHRQLLSKLVLKELSQDLSCNDIKTHIEKLVIDTSFEWLKYAFKPLTTTDSFNFGKALSELKDNIPDRLSDDDKYLLVNDIGEWEKHWKKYQSQIPSQKRSLISFRNLISLGKTLDIDAEAGVALLTGPMSKSLEFEVVFIIGLSEGTFPDYRAVRRGGEHIEQEKNNMFMAVSRAKRLCYLSYPKEKLMPWGDIKRQNPSRFIGLALQAQE